VAKEKKAEDAKRLQLTISLNFLNKYPSTGRAEKAIKKIREFAEKNSRAKKENIKIASEVNEKVWGHGMVNVPQKVELEILKEGNATRVFLKGGKQLEEYLKKKSAEEKEKAKKAEEKKKAEEEKKIAEEKKTEEEKKAEEEKARKLEEKRELEKAAQKAEFK
jgi:ribosomal protein L31E